MRTNAFYTRSTIANLRIVPTTENDTRRYKVLHRTKKGSTGSAFVELPKNSIRIGELNSRPHSSPAIVQTEILQPDPRLPAGSRTDMIGRGENALGEKRYHHNTRMGLRT